MNVCQVRKKNFLIGRGIMEDKIDMESPIEIICREHGSFWMTGNDHLGYNKEGIAYGCWKCGDKVILEEEE